MRRHVCQRTKLVDLANQLAALKASGAIRAELHPDGSLKAVEFSEAQIGLGTPRNIRPETPARDDLRDSVLGNGPPDVQLDPTELRLPRGD